MNVKESRTVDLKNNMPESYRLVISIGDKEMKFQAEVITKIIAE